MAVLQNIRNKAGLLIGIIAFALLAFLLGDMLNNGSFGQPDRTLAEINGDDISIDEYQARLNELTEVYKMNTGQVALDNEVTQRVQEEAWNALVRDIVMQAEYDQTGIAVTGDEIFDMVQGENVAPLIQQLFANPQTGQVDKTQILNFLKSFDVEGGQEREAYWMFIESELARSRKNEKYNNALAKGLLVNSEEAKFNVEAAKSSRSVDFFSVAYSTISDSTIDVSSSEIKAYYNEHKALYTQDESRNIEYISFPIEASYDDENYVEDWSEKIAVEFKTIPLDETSRYVRQNSDETWEEKFLGEAEVEEGLKEFAFKNELGDIYGPYKEGAIYKVSKLVARELRSDSVQASHILIQEASPERTEEVADSLLQVLKKNKRKMADLAQQYSKDQGSAMNGGDLGWFSDGQMVPAFNKASFEGKTGEVQKVTTQYGIHLLIVNKKSKAVEKVKIATVLREVEASNTTYRNIYTQASKLRSESTDYTAFKAAAKEAQKRVRFGNNIMRTSQTVMGLTDSKEIVRWAYKAEAGDVSDVIEVDNQFVVATLTAVKEKGDRPVDEVSSTIKSTLIKQKKAAQIMAKIEAAKEGSKTITSLASKMNSSINTANNLTFNSYSVPQAGVEPKLVGAISVAEQGTISAPIEGNRGVYVFKVNEVTASDIVPNIEDEKQRLAQTKAYMVNYQSFNTLQEAANIKDMRLLFY